MPDAADARRRVGEIPLDEVLLEADRLENLRAAIALQRRDAHLGHHLQHALVQRLDVVLDRLLVGDARQHSAADHVVERLERQIRVHRPGAVADEQRQMMHFARFAGLDDERRAIARALADEMVVHACGREQARNRRELHVHAAVRQDDDRVALFDRLARAPLQILERARQTGAAGVGVEQHRQRHGLESALADMAQPRELVVVDDGRLHLDLTARLGPRLQQIRLGADRRAHRRHQLFANRVERRVRHLREQLREVVVEQPRLVRQHGERRVRAHRPDRLFAVLRHRRQQNLQILLGVAEGALPIQHRVVIGQRQKRRRLEVFERHHVLARATRRTAARMRDRA